jgi:hypothetical protein
MGPENVTFWAEIEYAAKPIATAMLASATASNNRRVLAVRRDIPSPTVGGQPKRMVLVTFRPIQRGTGLC